MGHPSPFVNASGFSKAIQSSGTRPGITRQESRHLCVAWRAPCGAHHQSSRKDELAMNTPERIPIPELSEKLHSRKKPVVVDVREKKEIADRLLPGMELLAKLGNRNPFRCVH